MPKMPCWLGIDLWKPDQFATKRDHRAALQEIEELMNAEPGSPEEDRLDVLATLVKVYEDEHYPFLKICADCCAGLLPGKPRPHA